MFKRFGLGDIVIKLDIDELEIGRMYDSVEDKYIFFYRFGWHGIEPCKLKKSEARNALDLYVNGDDDTKGELDRRFGKKYMEMLMNEYLSLNYLEENSKQCPKCCAKIEVSVDCCFYVRFRFIATLFTPMCRRCLFPLLIMP